MPIIAASFWPETSGVTHELQQDPGRQGPPNDIYVAIEIPANHAPIKYEIDKDTDCLFVDRFMATPMFYPANYGFIPNTLADDGDPLDVGGDPIRSLPVR